MGKNQEDAAAEMNALLSIIVPVYNAATFLPRCLESLIGQTYRDLEIICVDDGSTDASGAILDEYAARDARIKVIHQENAGVSAARNQGLDLAEGSFIFFVDADDWLEPDACEKCMEFMSSGVDLLTFGCFIEGSPSEDYRMRLESHLAMESRTVSKLTPALQLAIGGEIWNKVYRRSLVEEYKLRFPVGLAYGEDKVFQYCYASVARTCASLSQRLYHYRVHSDSAMARLAARQDQGDMARQVFERVRRFYAKHGIAEKIMRPVLALLFFEYYVYGSQVIPSDRHVAFCKAVYREARDMKLMPYCRFPELQAMRREHMGAVERLFHSFVANRECYGLGRYTVWSVTYEPMQRVHHFLGHRIMTSRY